MGDALAQAGYTTGYWGKWGYGGSRDMQNPTIDNVQTLPTSHGYKFVVAELHHVRAHTFFQPTLWNAPSKRRLARGLELKANSMVKYRNQKSYSNYPASQNHPDYPKVAYCDDVYAFACLDFVRNQALEYNRSGKPFFGLFAAQIPHAPFAEVQKLPNWDHDYKDKSFFQKLSPQSRQWCAMVTRIDAHFGNILKALEDPNGDGDKSDSVADNTLVIFSADNGPETHAFERLEKFDQWSSGKYRGLKRDIYEGGHRVPFIVRWPARVKAGTSCDDPTCLTDLLATMAEILSQKLPADAGEDSVSMLPNLVGEPKQPVREAIVHHSINGTFAIRQGKWKLIDAPHSGGWSRPKPAQKALYKDLPKIQLYDLKKDPAESRNVSVENPSIVKKLKTLLEKYREDGRSAPIAR